MHPGTSAALERLENASWFSRVGINEGDGAAVVTSWSQAIEHCDTSAWEDLQLEALNQYRECIARRSRERLQLWNDAVDQVKTITRPLIDRKIATVVREHALPEIFKNQVNWDITGFCMEAEYADLCAPGFFTNIGGWYLKGHFPCGWWGVLAQAAVRAVKCVSSDLSNRADQIAIEN